MSRSPDAAVSAILSRVPNPRVALGDFESLRASGIEIPEPVLEPLLFVLGSSRALARGILAGGAEAIRFLGGALALGRVDVPAHVAALEREVGADPARADLPAILRRFKRREILRIGARDLTRLASVDDTMRELSSLAEAAAEMATRHARARARAELGSFDERGEPFRFVVLAMGKLGGGELNYSSDIDLVYLHRGGGTTSGGTRASGGDAASVAARIAEIVTKTLGEVTGDGNVFRVDLRLRPEGQNGPIVNSFESALTYYESWGQTWERAAMLKARPVGGDLELGREFLAEMEPFVYRRYLDFETIEEIQAMKARVDGAQKAERLVRDVKLGPGGIREVEFVAQVMQLVHGGRDARLRRRSTLDTLAAAAIIGLLAADEAERLAVAYRFLRDVEHKIQIDEERQTQLLPSDPESERELARRLGFRADGAAARAMSPEVLAFRAALDEHRAVVRRSFERIFRSPRRVADPEGEDEARKLFESAGDPASLPRIRALGVRDAEAAVRDLAALRDGPPGAPSSPRRRKALYTLAPALFTELRASSDPDLALRHMAEFVAAVGARSSFLALLNENPDTLRLLVGLFASSEPLSSFFLRHPELIDSLVRADLARVRKDRAELATELASLLAATSDYESDLDTIRRFRSEEFLRIGVNDIHGLLDLTEVQEQLSDLAEACVEAAIAVAARQVADQLGPAPGRFAVIGMGKLGGREINYNSDLDLIFVWDAPGGAGGTVSPAEWFTKLAQRLMSTLQVTTREGFAYRIDTRLRPSGTQGPLVSSLKTFRRYHETSSVLWERQALVRARGVAGDRELLAEAETIVERFVYGRGLTDEEAAEISRMRARMERELARETETRWNLKTGPGGIVDVEFATQMLQLRHGHERPAVRERRTERALDALHREGSLADDDWRSLSDGHRFLRRLESRLRLDRDQAVEVLAVDGEEAESLARQLSYAPADGSARGALVEDVRRTRAEVRAAYDRVRASLGENP